MGRGWKQNSFPANTQGIWVAGEDTGRNDSEAAGGVWGTAAEHPQPEGGAGGEGGTTEVAAAGPAERQEADPAPVTGGGCPGEGGRGTRWRERDVEGEELGETVD